MKDKNKTIKMDFKNNTETGKRGEDIACIFLRNKKYQIIERNYLRKWGEIDIIAFKDNMLTFIEVKSIIDTSESERKTYRPEENVHIWKQIRLRRTMQTYMAQHRYPLDTAFLFHIVIVRMNINTHRAKASMIENVII